MKTMLKVGFMVVNWIMSMNLSIGQYQNLAVNPRDNHNGIVNSIMIFPHASSNSETRNDSAFWALNAIDGKTNNIGHGSLFPSWGPEKRTDLWWKVDFGQNVRLDKVVIYIRADFPHDGYWKSAVLKFSDGSEVPVSFEKTSSPQVFPLGRNITTSYLLITGLVQDEPLNWCGFTEVEAWGYKN